jgi:heptosyltransferase III
MHILIIRPGAIGDTLLTLPVLQALRERYSHPHITLVGNAAVLPLACATGIIDETSDYQATQWSELFSHKGITAPSLQAQLQPVELAICWLHDNDGIVTNNLRRAGIPQVITAPGRPAPDERIHIMTYLAQTIDIPFEAENPVGARLCSLTNESSNKSGGRGAVDKPVWPTKTPLVPLYGLVNRAPTSNIVLPDLKIKEHNRTPTRMDGRLAIHPGSGGAAKCWPIERFAALIIQLWQRHIPILLLAGPAEETRVAELRQLLPSPPDPSLYRELVNAPLLEVAQQLLSCRGYLGNDTGITHLAALLGVPTLALFGPSDPVIWQPQGPIVRILHTAELGNLSEDVVIHTLESLCL